MRVVFLQDVPKQGNKGEVKNVSEGYARNFLLPRQLARLATPEVLKELDAQKATEARKERQLVTAAKQLAEQLNAYALTIPVRTGEGGKLFGAVTAKHIADGLAAAGFSVDKKKIALPEAIHSLGTTLVTIRLHHDVAAQLRVHVTQRG